MTPPGTKPPGMKPSHRLRTEHRPSRADLQRELEELSTRVEELQAAVGEMEHFAAQAAHELMTPLVMAETFADVVAGRLHPTEHEDSRRDLDALRRTAARTRRLVETLLHEARSAGRPLRHDSVDLGQLARDTVAMLSHEIERREARIEIGELPTVAGEAELLGSVLTNLVVNALKYNPRQGGTIRIEAECGPEWCAIHVDDEAPPIPDEDRVRIFEPYHRGRSERRVRGAGLGLAITRRIVERHGGTIEVAAAPTGGNRFTFTVPAA